MSALYEFVFSLKETKENPFYCSLYIDNVFSVPIALDRMKLGTNLFKLYLKIKINILYYTMVIVV